MLTSKRKLDHIKIVLENDCSFHSISAGFEDVLIFHDSVPEIDFSDVDMSGFFLGKKISAPILIDAITGGFKGAEKINFYLAENAEKHGIAFALGSQRAMLENPDLSYTYKVRKVAPSIPVIGNIGIANLSRKNISKLDSLVKDIDADALAIHFNPIQEVIQKEGNTDFSNKIEILNEICDVLDVPLIVKEVGHGFSERALKKLNKTKISYINIAGAGGTSWSKIEYLRGGKLDGFSEDGIPTVISLLMAKKYTRKNLISSGGIRNGIHIAKSIVLGAEIGGAAYPFIKSYYSKSTSSLIQRWKDELKTFMFTRGVKTIGELRKLDVFFTGRTSELAAVI